MHTYVKQTLDRIQQGQSSGHRGYLRVRKGVDQEQAIAYLTVERDALESEVNKTSDLLMSITSISALMQMLILIKLLLANPDIPVDFWLVCDSQHCTSAGYLTERIEEATAGLMMLAPSLLEVVKEL